MADDFDSRLADSGVVAIMRAHCSGQLIRAAEALLGGGVSVIEVAMTTPGALRVIEEATSRFATALTFGAGTVIGAQSANAAIQAGAQFVVAPNFDSETVDLCRRQGVPVIPGAYTPTEIVEAWQAGADLVKVFPASVGGPSFIAALRAPLPQVRLCAVGGITLDNVGAFINAGVEAVGVGGDLVNNQLLDAGDFVTITARAQRFCEEIRRARER
ncbi:MAG: bifunctional 4-hydroxy-2-oxoglutarate aldolase/2-dehydro-3-deoxy-phosphogluconate aldolase [Propionibacteriaceae bacterium]|jgi:2-dehydro-3-deoxyphosphogluconate aldolase/(4S)-4-hydroxy-2-oxoglutarate aldolase|nr:bifunctional 4-hydroxy-2-oxoglutarate aldolase/2-dehydro-3-deoxy-phosphogluconate aldolase [Propionibacteriaceae bacterium]